MDQAKIKGFFERPEGKFGMVVIVGLVVAALMGFNTILPTLVKMAENTLYLGGMVAVIMGVIYLVFIDKQFPLLVSNLFKNTMRFITGVFIPIDPIGILKNYIDDMRKNIGKMEIQISTLNGQKHNLIKTINDHKEDAEGFKNLAQAAKKQGLKDQVVSNARKMEREINFVKNLEKPLEKMEIIYKVLDKMTRNVSLLMDDTVHEVKIKEIEYKSIKAAHAAMSSARKMISGSSQKDLFEQSMEFIAEDIANKMGEMDRIMEASTDFMNGIDLQNGVWDEKGLATLESIENGGSLFLYDEKKSPDAGISTNFTTDKKEFANFFKTK